MTIKSVHVVTGGSIDSLDYESGISDAAYKNLGKVLPVDERLQTPEGINLIGPIWKQDTRFTYVFNWGVPIEEEFMPNEYFLKGPVRPIADYRHMWNSALVSDKFRIIVEKFEPGVHQFFPAQVFWRRNNPIAEKFYFFNVCNNLDSVHSGKSELPPRETIFAPAYDMEVSKPWKVRRGIKNKIVFDRKKISGCHLWRDGYLLSRGLNCTDEFMNACLEAQILGIKFSAGNETA